jgi:hypothetical protein
MLLSQERSSDRDHPAKSRMNIRLASEPCLPNHDGVVGGDIAPDALRWRGTLATHYLKQLAQALVAYVEGMHNVIDQIEIRDSLRGAWVEVRESSTKTETPFPIPAICTGGESHDAGF